MRKESAVICYARPQSVCSYKNWYKNPFKTGRIRVYHHTYILLIEFYIIGQIHIVTFALSLDSVIELFITGTQDSTKVASCIFGMMKYIYKSTETSLSIGKIPRASRPLTVFSLASQYNYMIFKRYILSSQCKTGLFSPYFCKTGQFYSKPPISSCIAPLRKHYKNTINRWTK